MKILLILICVNAGYHILKYLYRIKNPIEYRHPVIWGIGAVENTVWLSIFIYALLNWI